MPLIQWEGQFSSKGSDLSEFSEQTKSLKVVSKPQRNEIGTVVGFSPNKRSCNELPSTVHMPTIHHLGVFSLPLNANGDKVYCENGF